MRIVPPAFRPWEAPVERRHAPEKSRGKKGYQAYRACLRWDFGFACPFCLCHEVDVAKQGVVGSGQFEIEHFRAQKQHPQFINAYDNCYWACRSCNRARRAKPHVDARQRALLDPCRSAWKDHFVVANDEMVPRRSDDHDAAYTVESYKPNEPKKVTLRQLRREAIEDALEATGPEFWQLHDELMQLGVVHRRPELTRQAAVLQRKRRKAFKNLELLQAVPLDCERRCRCGVDDHHTCGAHVDAQCVDV